MGLEGYMIGDWVRVITHNGGEIIAVRRLDYTDFANYGEGNNNCVNYEPLPLDTDFLERVGLRDNGLGMYVFPYPNSHLYVASYRTPHGHIFGFGTCGYEGKGDVHSSRVFSLSYVHELQHIIKQLKLKDELNLQ